MSRTRTRASKRRRRMKDDLLEVIRQARNADARALETNGVKHDPRPDHGALYRLLRDLDHSDQRLWPLAEAIACDEEEKAIIAQIVAPHLTWRPPSRVLRQDNPFMKTRRLRSFVAGTHDN